VPVREGQEVAKVRVLHFIDSLRVGGKERQLVELLKGLSQHSEMKLLLVCMDDDDFYATEVRRLPIRLEYLIRKTRWDPSIFYRFYQIVKTFRPEVIHTNSWMTSFYALPIGKLSGAKLINGSIRNAFSSGGLRWKLEKVILSLSDYRLANSKAGLLSRGFRANSERNAVIYNGFDCSRVESVDKDDPLRGIVTDNRKIVGMVAEFSDTKDYATYFLAAKEVLNRRRDVLFLAVGDGKNFEMCRRMVAESSNNIKLVGKVKNVEECVAHFDIGVLATFTEGISNSIMEYMALSKPVIATEGGGTSEIVVDGVTGILVPSGNPGILAAKIEYLLDNPTVGQSMGMVGRKLLEQQFSLKQLTDKTLSLYESALKSFSN
jgi:glycosyltransferase involved in cell wall biosynthesis